MYLSDCCNASVEFRNNEPGICLDCYQECGYYETKEEVSKMDTEQTIAHDLEKTVRLQTEEEFAATHDGCKNFIEYFNTHPQTIIFGHSKPHTLEKSILTSIVKNVKKSLRTWFFNRRKGNV